MGRRSESDTYRLTEWPGNSWWLLGQKSGDTEKWGQNIQYRQQPEHIRTAAPIIFKRPNTCWWYLKRVQAITLDCKLYLIIFLSFIQMLFWKFCICVPACSFTWLAFLKLLMWGEQMECWPKRPSFFCSLLPTVYYLKESLGFCRRGLYFRKIGLGKQNFHQSNCWDLGTWKHEQSDMLETVMDVSICVSMRNHLSAGLFKTACVSYILVQCWLQHNSKVLKGFNTSHNKLCFTTSSEFCPEERWRFVVKI